MCQVVLWLDIDIAGTCCACVRTRARALCTSRALYHIAEVGYTVTYARGGMRCVCVAHR